MNLLGFTKHYVASDIGRWGMITTFPQCNFSLEFSEILGQNLICYHWLSVSGNNELIHCGILIDMSYSDLSDWGCKISLASIIFVFLLREMMTPFHMLTSDFVIAIFSSINRLLYFGYYGWHENFLLKAPYASNRTHGTSLCISNWRAYSVSKSHQWLQFIDNNHLSDIITARSTLEDWRERMLVGSTHRVDW